MDSESGLSRIEFVATNKEASKIGRFNGLDDFDIERTSTRPKPSVEDFISALCDFINVYVDSTEEEFNEVLRQEKSLKEQAELKYRGIRE